MLQPSKEVATGFFRPQFSLRMLLLFMLLLAIGLAIFRWPWKVTAVIKDGVRTAQFRRGWKLAPLQHGLETIVTAEQQLKSEAFHTDGELRWQKTFEPPGVLQSAKQFFPASGRVHEKVYEESPSGKIVCETDSFPSLYRYRWTTLAGELLESQEQQVDPTSGAFRLTKWNELPANEAFAKFCAELPDEQTRQGWLQERVTNGAYTVADLGDATLQIEPLGGARTGTPVPPADQFLLHVGNVGSNSNGRAGDVELYYVISNIWLTGSNHKVPAKNSLLEQMLMQFEREQVTLRCRYGIVCLVPIDKQTLAEDDPAGVLQVKFAAGSQQQQDWLQPARCMPAKVAKHADALEQFLAGASFSLDVSQIQGVEPPPVVATRAAATVEIPRPAASEILRPRRDILGIFLWRNNYRIEQHGNKLVVLPRNP